LGRKPEQKLLAEKMSILDFIFNIGKIIEEIVEILEILNMKFLDFWLKFVLDSHKNPFKNGFRI